MRKYILVLSVFVLSFTLLGFNANFASASNCASGDLFSSVTGKSCGTALVAVECPAGDLFSSATGQACTTWSTTPTTNTIPTATNLTIGSRGAAVIAFQQTLTNAGFSPGPIDGIYGSKTDAAARSYYIKYPRPITIVPPTPCPLSTDANGTITNICPPTSSNSPVISGLTGPQTLDLNQQGKWTITASSPSGGYLSYSVVWGDEALYATTSASPVTNSVPQQSAIFLHSYSRAGIYTPTFTVTSPNTINCITTPCPSNGGSTQASLSVNVGNVATPSLTITTPSPLPNGKVGDNSYQVILHVLPDSLPTNQLSWWVAEGNLPLGLSLSASDLGEIITGTPAVAGIYHFTLTAYRPSNGDYASKQFTLTVDPATTTTSPLSITTSSPLPNATLGANYSTTISATGGTGSYAWTSSGILPMGLTLTSANCFTAPCQGPVTISGTPMQVGPFNFTLGVSSDPLVGDAPTLTASKSFTLTVEKGATTLAVGDVNGDGAINCTDVTWTGEAAVSLRTLTAEQKARADMDNDGDIDVGDVLLLMQRYNLNCSTVPVGTLSITTSSPLPKAELGVNYSATISATGGTGSYAWTLSGILPTGLTVTSANCFTAPCQGPVTISGTPMQVGPFNFTLNVSSDPLVGDGPTLTATKAFSVTVMDSIITPCLSCIPITEEQAVLGAEAFNFTQLLKNGSSGSEVMELQKFLNGAGYDSGTTDGKFGPKTQTALIQFQLANGLVGDGVVGPMVRAILNQSR